MISSYDYVMLSAKISIVLHMCTNIVHTIFVQEFVHAIFVQFFLNPQLEYFSVELEGALHMNTMKGT